MFPSSYFRTAYDELKKRNPLKADKEYITILKISSEEGELTAQSAIRELLRRGESLSAKAVNETIQSGRGVRCMTDVAVREVDLAAYDALLAEAAAGGPS
jgi:hypothetical protein